MLSTGGRHTTGGMRRLVCLTTKYLGIIIFFHSSISKMLIAFKNCFKCIYIKRKHLELFINLNYKSTNCFIIMCLEGPGGRSWYSDSLRARLSGGRILVGRDFLHLSRPDVEPIQPPIQWVPGLSRG